MEDICADRGKILFPLKPFLAGSRPALEKTMKKTETAQGDFGFLMAPRAGLEPATRWLQLSPYFYEGWTISPSLKKRSGAFGAYW